MPTQSLAREPVQAVRIVVVGRVQGLGARPTAARTAAKLGLAGSVTNTPDGLILELEGSAADYEGRPAILLEESCDPNGAESDTFHWNETTGQLAIAAARAAMRNWQVSPCV